jgi:hypothetical protein
MYWLDENPQTVPDAHHQTDPQITVWCSILAKATVGLLFLDNGLRGNHYGHLETIPQPHLGAMILISPFDFTSSRMKHHFFLTICQQPKQF